MKTAPYVMLFPLFFSLSAAALEPAGEGIDQEIILVGNDESVMTLPLPWEPPWPFMSPFFPILPAFQVLPPVLPPKGDWMTTLTNQFPLFFLEIPSSRPPYSDAPP